MLYKISFRYDNYLINWFKIRHQNPYHNYHVIVYYDYSVIEPNMELFGIAIYYLRTSDFTTLHVLYIFLNE